MFIVETLYPIASPYRSVLDPKGTLPLLHLVPETQLYNRVYYGVFLPTNVQICELHLSHNSPFEVDAAHVSWVQRLDAGQVDRPKGVGIATHLILMEHLETKGIRLVSDPYIMSPDGIAMWRRMVGAGVARETNRIRLPGRQPRFAAVAINKLPHQR